MLKGAVFVSSTVQTSLSSICLFMQLMQLDFDLMKDTKVNVHICDNAIK